MSDAQQLVDELANLYNATREWWDRSPTFRTMAPRSLRLALARCENLHKDLENVSG